MRTQTITRPGGKSHLLLTEGSCSAKIYPSTRQKAGRCYEQFNLVYSEAGHRRIRSFGSLADAKAEAEIVLTKLVNGQTQVLQLTNADRENYVLATQELAEMRLPLLTVVREFRAASALLRGKATVMEAARYYVHSAMVELPRKTVPEVAEELLAAKCKDGLSEAYLHPMKVRLRRFSNSFPGQILDVSKISIESWLRSLEMAPRSRNNCAGAVTTLFRFARRCGYLPDKPTVADDLAQAKLPNGEIAIYTCAELRHILHRLERVRPDLIPVASLGSFAGLRTAEIQRIEWSDINFTEGFIIVRAAMAKTRQRRIVPLQSNLAEWLAPFREATGLVCAHWTRAYEALQRATVGTLTKPYGQEEPGVSWKRNGLRHSFGSYRLPVLKDVNALALEMGNTPSVIFRHYRELVTESEAAKYWQIRPRRRSPTRSATCTNFLKTTQESGNRVSL